MKTITFVAGLAAGMAIASAAVTAMYPDVPRRAMRDTRRMWRSGKRAVTKIGNMMS